MAGGFSRFHGYGHHIWVKSSPKDVFHPRKTLKSIAFMVMWKFNIENVWKCSFFNIFSCFLSYFWGHFYIEGSKSGIFSQQMLTKISENVFHILNSSHLKYHVNTTNRSWKNSFFTPLAHKVPLENLTFIFKVRNLFSAICAKKRAPENLVQNKRS